MSHYRIDTPPKFFSTALIVFINSAISTYIGHLKTTHTTTPDQLTSQLHNILSIVSQTLNAYFAFASVYYVLFQLLGNSLALALGRNGNSCAPLLMFKSVGRVTL